MTNEMLALAHKNQQEAGVENVEFLKGEIEDIPLPDEHVDVLISNCVINLSTKKEKAIREAFRVLKRAGRFAVSDMIFLGQKRKLPPEVVRNIELWSGCVSGALEKGEYEELLAATGFEDISVEVTHTYDEAAVSAMSVSCGGSGQYADARSIQALREVPLASAFIRARKPQR
jgi:arsenite methyltransferase